MKVSCFINRLYLCMFDWQKKINKRKNVRFFDEFSLRKDDRCRQVKDETRNQSMFCRSIVPPARIKRNSMRFDGDWRRVDAQRKISPWQLFSLYSEDLFNFIRAKHKSFDASIFIDNQRRKSLAEESIEKTNVSSPKEIKQNTFFFIRTFLSEKKTVKRSFHFNSMKLMKKSRRTTVETISQIRCSWKINESKMKIEVKMAERKEKKAFERENLQNFDKISQFEKRKFAQFRFKWQLKIQNLRMNSKKFDWRFKSKWKWQKKRKKTASER